MYNRFWTLIINSLLNDEQLKISSTAVFCIYLCVEDVYCLSLTSLVSGMCCFEKTNEYNSAKGNTSSNDECKTRIMARKGTWIDSKVETVPCAF